MSHYPVITVPVVLWALDEEHDVSLIRPPQLLVGKPRVDDHVSVQGGPSGRAQAFVDVKLRVSL